MSHSLKLGLTVAALAALGLSAAHPAAAQTTIYNFQATVIDNGGAGASPTYTGVGVLGNGTSSTSIFNREAYYGFGSTSQVGGTVGTTSFGTVVDSNNNKNTALVFKYDAAAYQTTGPTSPSNLDRVLLDGFQSSTAPSSISLTGLAANTPFTAVFYAENGTFADLRRTTYNLTDSSHANLGGASNTATTTANSGTAFTTTSVNGIGNYATFTGTADANGGIYASYSGVPNGGVGVFSGVQFLVGTPSAAPEPSQLAGLGFTALGALGLILKSRKRSISATPAA